MQVKSQCGRDQQASGRTGRHLVLDLLDEAKYASIVQYPYPNQGLWLISAPSEALDVWRHMVSEEGHQNLTLFWKV